MYFSKVTLYIAVAAFMNSDFMLFWETSLTGKYANFSLSSDVGHKLVKVWPRFIGRLSIWIVFRMNILLFNDNLKTIKNRN